MTDKAKWLLIALLCLLAGALAGYLRGRWEGGAYARAAQSVATVQQLQDVLASHTQLVAQSNAASQKLRGAMAARAAADSKTSKELKDALALTAADRAGCVLDAGSVRHLDAARDRAAQAAAGGASGAVPAAAGKDW